MALSAISVGYVKEMGDGILRDDVKITIVGILK